MKNHSQRVACTRFLCSIVTRQGMRRVIFIRFQRFASWRSFRIFILCCFPSMRSSEQAIKQYLGRQASMASKVTLVHVSYRDNGGRRPVLARCTTALESHKSIMQNDHHTISYHTSSHLTFLVFVAVATCCLRVANNILNGACTPRQDLRCMVHAGGIDEYEETF